MKILYIKDIYSRNNRTLSITGQAEIKSFLLVELSKAEIEIKQLFDQ